MQPDLNQPKKPEQVPLPSPEQAVKSGEASQAIPIETSTAPPAQTQQPAATPVPPPVQPPTQVSASGQTSTIDPTLAQLPAEDVDTIEKVWVEKSDQIIEEKKDDPFAEDEAQHNLSKAYIKKRFNLDVK